MRVIITGGTGSLGKELISQLLPLDLDRLIIMSRDELKQSELKKIYPEGGTKGLRIQRRKKWKYFLE